MGASVAVIAIIKREEELVEHFEQMRATSPTTAQSIEALRVEHGHIFRRLEQRAVIRQTPNGLYFLDLPSWNSMRATRRRMLMIVLVLVGLVAVAVAFTASRRAVVDSSQTTNL